MGRVWLAGCLASCLMLSSCAFEWESGDGVEFAVDPDIELKRIFDLSGDTYQDVAYYVLDETKKRPTAVRYTMLLHLGDNGWLLQGGIGELPNSRGIVRTLPNLAVSRPSRYLTKVYWDRDHPDMVFFIHGSERQTDPTESVYRFYRDTKTGRKLEDHVVLVYHPGQKAPTRFRLRYGHTEAARDRWHEAQKTDPVALPEPFDWSRQPFKPNWSLLYQR